MQFPTGGTARERMPFGGHDSVKFRGRQYSLDERRICGKTFRLFTVLKCRFGVSDFLFSQCFSQRPEDSVFGTFFYVCRQTIVKFSTELLYQVILCRSKNRNICVRRLALAQRGAGHVNPNPMVGCVIVKDGKIIGEGWHEHIGGLHAERTRSRTAPRTARAQTCTSRLSRAATGDARRRAQTQSSSTRSAACSSAASTRTRW